MLLEEGQTAQYALRGKVHRKKTVGMVKWTAEPVCGERDVVAEV